MERTKSALAERFYELAMNVIADENYDIITDGGFLDSDFANAATSIFKNLLKTNGHKGWRFRTEPYSVYAMGCNWKFSNSRPCFISCSDENGTGVSRSEACIFGRIYDLDEEDVKELLDMMNEAWYHMMVA